jgi:hypothetical protein
VARAADDLLASLATQIRIPAAKKAGGNKQT